MFVRRARVLLACSFFYAEDATHMCRPRLLLALLLPRPAHALHDYKYPIARAALAHASSTRGPCTAWQPGACSSYAQSHEDLAVYEQFFSVPGENPEAPGVFVEMGALDGVTLSNTLAFERSQMNWTGDQGTVEDKPDTAGQCRCSS